MNESFIREYIDLFGEDDIAAIKGFGFDGFDVDEILAEEGY